MADPDKKYTLVQDANENMFLVSDDEAEAPKPVSPEQKSQIESILTPTEAPISAMFSPLGSGVRVKLPRIFD